MSHPNIVAVTDSSFASAVLASERPVLLKFEAEWCGPCKAMKPAVDEIAAEYADRVTVVSLDIDQNNQTPYKLGVRGVPTVILFKDGQVVAQKVGLQKKADLVALLSKVA